MNFGRNFAKFGDFGHVRNFLTNKIQNPALELQSLRQDAVGEFYRTSRILLKLASFLFVKILFPKFFLRNIINLISTTCYV